MTAKIPLSQIDQNALPRDRTHLEPSEMEALRDSIAQNGLRQPIEVFPLHDPTEDHKYGLISGLRRLTAAREIAEWGGAKEIDAFIRKPKNLAKALEAVLEENEVRADPSPWERGAFLLACVEEGTFQTLEAGADALYSDYSRMKRRRTLWCAEIVRAFDGLVDQPHRWSLRRLQAIYFAMINGYTEIMTETLHEAQAQGWEEQWRRLKPYTEESKERPAHGPDKTRPRRHTHLKPRLTLRRDRVAGGYRLWVMGRQATDEVMDEIFELVEGNFLEG